MCYGPLRQIWICTTGHCGKFSYLRATAVNLVISNGPLRGMKLYSKICNDFCAMGHSTKVGLELPGHDAVFGYVLCALGCSAGFGYVYGP